MDTGNGLACAPGVRVFRNVSHAYPSLNPGCGDGMLCGHTLFPLRGSGTFWLPFS